MIRTPLTLSPLLATLALAGFSTAQQVVIATDDGTDTIVAFSPIDGSLYSSNLFPIPNTVQVSALAVGDQIWISEQNGDRVVRYDFCGNVLGTLGPTLPGGGLDNIRGMNFFGGKVYVTNDGTNNGATADSLVTFDPAGNYLGTIALSASPSPFSVLPFQGDMLVVSSSGPDRVHRYTLAGASLGTFNDSASLGFSHASALASDGNVWLSTFTTDTIVKLDAATGNVLLTLPADNARGIFELANGNLLWTTQYGGAFVYDMVTMSNSQVYAGSMYNLNLVDLSVGQAACHRPIGTGCYSFSGDRSNLFQLFPDVPSAKASLDGNAMLFSLTPTGYTAN
jgi:streptogramin lyase